MLLKSSNTLTKTCGQSKYVDTTAKMSSGSHEHHQFLFATHTTNVVQRKPREVQHGTMTVLCQRSYLEQRLKLNLKHLLWSTSMYSTSLKVTGCMGILKKNVANKFRAKQKTAVLALFCLSQDVVKATYCSNSFILVRQFKCPFLDQGIYGFHKR